MSSVTREPGKIGTHFYLISDFGVLKAILILVPGRERRYPGRGGFGSIKIFLLPVVARGLRRGRIETASSVVTGDKRMYKVPKDRR